MAARYEKVLDQVLVQQKETLDRFMAVTGQLVEYQHAKRLASEEGKEEAEIELKAAQARTEALSEERRYEEVSQLLDEIAEREEKELAEAMKRGHVAPDV